MYIYIYISNYTCIHTDVLICTCIYIYTHRGILGARPCRNLRVIVSSTRWGLPQFWRLDLEQSITSSLFHGLQLNMCFRLQSRSFPLLKRDKSEFRKLTFWIQEFMHLFGLACCFEHGNENTCIEFKNVHVDQVIHLSHWSFQFRHGSREFGMRTFGTSTRSASTRENPRA